MVHFFRKSWIAFLAIATTSIGAPLDVFVLSSKANVDFTTAGTDEKIGSFLVLNPSLGNVAVYLKFANDCNVEHFRRADLTVPLQSVKLVVDGVPQASLWTRGSDCAAVLSWSPPGPAPYADRYQLDVLVSWNASNVGIAGSYSESISLTAINIP